MQNNYSQPYIHSDFHHWQEEASRDLGWVLARFFPHQNNVSPFSFSLNLPAMEEAKHAFKNNRNLNGTIEITWNKQPDNPLKLKVPMPFYNIFIRRSAERSEALSYAWVPYLGESPGFRFIKKYSKTKSEKKWWRLGLMHGYYLEGVCNEKPKRKKGKVEEKYKPPGMTLFLAPYEYYHEEIRKIITLGCPVVETCVDITGKKKTLSKIGVIKDKLEKVSGSLHEKKDSLNLDEPDEDDLSHKVLVHFPLWLRGRICYRLFEEILTHRYRDIKGRPRKIINEENKKILEGLQAPTEEVQKEIWEYLIANSVPISNSIVPFNVLVEDGRLTYTDPENPADMVSLLTQFQRYNYKSDIIVKLQHIYRQNHPSFRGFICPVQSPETEKVGITLHLSRTTFRNVDSTGSMKQDDNFYNDDELGFGAGLVPFYHYNDGPRNMMGAKNLRQALPLVRRSSPAVTTGGEDMVLELVKPLIEIGICPDASDVNNKLALGKDLLVAYLPWEGMNVEDAVVAGGQVVERGDFNAARVKEFSKEIKPGYIPTVSGTVLPFDGLAKKGKRLFSGSLIASFTLEGADNCKPYEIRYTDRSPAVLKDISFEKANAWTTGILKYTLEKEFLPGIGDKLMGRHGNKGIIGAIIPAEKMPKLPDDSSIPEKFRGKPIDILLNPHGVISRMNIGQLLETHIGWLLHCGVAVDDLLLPEYKGKERHIGRAFFTGINHGKIQELLEKYGLDKYGRVKLKLPDGGETKSPVVVGFQHIVRLKHIPELKAQARRGGPEARYSASTGQAVHGRERGGGQKVGEMELWALSAYEAHTIIEEMLGVKSDVALVNAQKNGETLEDYSSFLSRFKDMLFALLINMERVDDGVRFSFLKPEDVLQKTGNGRNITNDDSLGKKASARFACLKGGEKPCGFKLLDGARIPVLPTERVKAKVLTIRLDDLLESIKYKRTGPLIEINGNDFTQKIKHIYDGTEAALAVSFENTKDQIKAILAPHKELYPKHWPKALNEVYLYGRFSEKKGKNFSSASIMEMLKKPNGRYNIGDLQITCPAHKTTKIIGCPPFKEHPHYCKGGMYDPGIFGSMSSVGLESKTLWGIIELPVEVPYPVSAFLNEMKEKMYDTSKIASIKYIPVLPLRYRLPVKRSDEYDEDTLTANGYRPILEICRQYDKVTDDVKKAYLEKDLNYQVKKLFNMLVERLVGKEGMIRKDGLGRRVDLSARMVISPDPDLKLNQIGVPTSVLIELLRDELLDWVKNEMELGDVADKLLESVGIIEKTAAGKDAGTPKFEVINELLQDWTWTKGEKGNNVLNLFYDLLLKFIDAHNDLVVILNRQPSLHKYSMQAFYPVLLKPDKGDVLRLCPLVCKGFGADFDGDEMTLHLPKSPEARNEATKLLPSNNMISAATGKPIIGFDQDFVLGTYWLAREESGMRNEFLEIFKNDCCKAMIPEGGMKKGKGETLLEHLIKDHKEASPEMIWQWMNLAYRCCSKMGVSFGFYELQELALSIRHKRDEINNNLPKTDEKIDAESLNKKYKTLGERYLGTVEAKSAMDTPGIHCAAMALSGARGAKQVIQLVVAKGFLSPGDIPFKPYAQQFIFTSSLVEGMNIEQAFRASMNARNSMCDKKLGTADAGYLTRRLVFALWPFYIVTADCESKEENPTPLTCIANRGFCAKCYGSLPDGNTPHTGFPAGLIAAQSLGERGTQLSMQSFHTGARGIDMEYVKKLLNGKIYMIEEDCGNTVEGKRTPLNCKAKGGVCITCYGSSAKADSFEDYDLFENAEGASVFINLLKSIDAYKDIETRHFQILWRVISESNERTLESATSEVGLLLLSRMAFESQKETLFKAALNEMSDPLSEPVARIISNTLKQ